MVAIADASMRLRVAGGERPSALCEHYAGDAAGPLRPYGFEVKQFEAESEALKLTEAELMATRGRLLDYFASVDRATAVAPRAPRLRRHVALLGLVRRRKRDVKARRARGQRRS